MERGGKLSGIESTDSAEAVQAALTGEPAPRTGTPCRTLTIGTFQRLFIGLHTKSGSKVHREAVVEMLASKLDTFTISDVLGYYEGKPEPTLIVEIAKTGGARLEPLARDLADAFEQDAVGIEAGGVFTRIFGADKRTESPSDEADQKQLARLAKVLSEGKKIDEIDADLQAWWRGRS